MTSTPNTIATREAQGQTADVDHFEMATGPYWTDADAVVAGPEIEADEPEAEI